MEVHEVIWIPGIVGRSRGICLGTWLEKILSHGALWETIIICCRKKISGVGRHNLLGCRRGSGRLYKTVVLFISLLRDVNTHGSIRETMNTIEERLNRGLANQIWLDIFPQFRLSHIVSNKLDHSPILLCLEGQAKRVSTNVFRFENSLLGEQDLDVVVTNWWDKEGLSNMLGKINSSMEDLKVRSRRLRLKFRKDIDMYRKEMDQSRGRRDSQAVGRMDELREKMAVLLAEEDSF